MPDLAPFTLAAKLTLDSSAYDQGLNNARDSGSKLGGALKTAFKVGAAAVAAATTAVTAFAGSAVSAGMQFDATMSEVAAISGAVGEDFDALRAKAQEMGATTKFSASESAEALTYMAMAGWKTEDMLGGIEGIMNLAAAAGEDLGTTSDIVTDALTAFGLSASDSGRFADVLAAASSNANTNVTMMGETFKYAAPLAGALGYSIEDTATAIGLMANAGIKGSQAGTALRSILTRMAKPTKESEAAMEALGVSLVDSEGNMKSFQDVMLDLRDAFHNDLIISEEEFAEMLGDLNTALEKGEISSKDYEKSLEMLMERAYGAEGAVMAEYAAMLGGQEAMSGLLAIVNASDEDFQKLTDSIYGAEGAAAAMAATMQDNLAGDITIMQSALEGFKIAVSDKLTPTLREFVQFGTDGLSRLTLAFQEGGLDSAMDVFGEILSEGLVMITQKLPEIVAAGTKLLGALLEGLSENSDTIASAAVLVATQLTQFLLDSAPLLLRTGLDLLLALALGISDSLPELIPTIVDVVLEIVDVLTDPETLGNLVDAAIAIMLALANGLIDALPRLIEKAPEIIANLVTALVENMPKLLEASLQMIKTLAETLLSKEHLEMLGEAALRIVTSIVDGIEAVLSSLWDVGKEAIDSIWEGLTSSDVFQWGKDLIDNFIGGIKEGWDKLKSGVSNVAQGIKDFLGFSEPKYGPLSDFHTYGPDMMKLYAEGIRDNAYLVTDQIEKSFNLSNAAFGKGTKVADMAPRTAPVTIEFSGSLAQLARVLQPEIRQETTRRGDIMIGGRNRVYQY